MIQNNSKLPLQGIRIVEMGSLIAGPFAGRILADFGAEVIKIEPPVEGDPLRKWGKMDGGTSLWWRVQSRNKKSIALDLHHPEGQTIAKKLIDQADVVIENFRVGKLEEWGLGWETLSLTNSKLIMLRVSGYGQTGPYRDRPGFGMVGEAMGGLRHLCAEPGRPPVRVGVSIGDSVTALHGVIGVLMALYHRSANGGRGQMVDVALYESVFNLMESMLPDFGRFGHVRQPTGSALSGIAPSNAYKCLNDRYVLIAGNSDGIFKKLMSLIGRPDLANDPSLETNDKRVPRADFLDAEINAWTNRLTLDGALLQLNTAGVPAGRVYTIEDIVNDPQYLAREMICETATPDGQMLKMPGLVPKMSATPGRIIKCGPDLGEHTNEVLRGIGMSEREIAEVVAGGIV